MIPTLSSDTWIEDRGDGWIVYRTTKGERWIIRGVCNCCGSCEVGVAGGDVYQVWTGIQIGQPGACLDRRYGMRLDIPVRPEIARLRGCVLTGEYLVN